MSVDKFGRSSASIARRPLALVPSRRLLQSAGALCRTGEFVDFKSAFARNIGNPIHSSDATTKDYVDQCMSKVKSAAQKTVTDSLELFVRSTYDLTKKYLDEQLVTLNTEVKEYVNQSVGNVQSSVQKSVKDSLEVIIQSTYTLTKDYLDKQLEPLNTELIKTKNDLLAYSFSAHSDTQSAKRELNKLRKQVNNTDEATSKMMERIKVLESGAAAVKSLSPKPKPTRVPPPKPTLVIGRAKPTHSQAKNK